MSMRMSLVLTTFNLDSHYLCYLESQIFLSLLSCFEIPCSVLHALAGLYHGSQAKYFSPSVVHFVFHNNSTFCFLLVLYIALFIAVHDLLIALVLCISFVVVIAVALIFCLAFAHCSLNCNSRSDFAIGG